MNFLALLFACLTLWCLSNRVQAAMSEKQLQAAVKLVRNMCLPKSKSTQEDIEKFQKGDFDSADMNAKCFLWCGLNSNKLITKENTLDYDLAVNLANKQLPEARKQPALESAGKCKDAAQTLDDKCVAAWEIAKCFYFALPSNYFLP